MLQRRALRLLCLSLLQRSPACLINPIFPGVSSTTDNDLIKLTPGKYDSFNRSLPSFVRNGFTFTILS